MSIASDSPLEVLAERAVPVLIPRSEAVEQGSEAWFALRCGKVTASRIVDVMAKPRVAGEGMRVNYMAQIILERFTGKPMKTYQNATMEEGNQWEPKARAAYAFMTSLTVEKVPFVDHPDIAMSGASPDGLVGKDGVLEIKSPYAATHFDTLVSGDVPVKYIKQIQWGLACTGRSWTDYVSYNDDMPENMRLFIKRVPRDSAMIGDIAAAVRSFQSEVDLRMSVLREKFP
jgi:putative phage-type endonuclease